MTRDRETIRMVSCATCEKDLLGSSEAGWLDAMLRSGRGSEVVNLPPLVAGRLGGRPFCSVCLTAADFHARRLAVPA